MTGVAQEYSGNPSMQRLFGPAYGEPMAGDARRPMNAMARAQVPVLVCFVVPDPGFLADVAVSSIHLSKTYIYTGLTNRVHPCLQRCLRR